MLPRLRLLLLAVVSFLVIPALALPASAADPVTTTTTLEITPSSPAGVGQQVTFKITVTAANGQTPTGTVSINTAGCGNLPEYSKALGPDGTATITTTVSGPYDYYFNACFFDTDDAGYLNSESASQPYSITDAPPTAAPMVTSHPTSRSAVSGQQVSFSSTASGQPAPSVRWQRSTNGGRSWQYVAGATTTSLQVTSSASLNGALYRAVFTNATGTATSRAVALFVTQSFLGYTNPSANAPIKRGSTLSVTFRLGDRRGVLLSDTVARTVPVSVQLGSSTPRVVASAPCSYNASTNLFRCNLKTSSKLAPGAYHLTTHTRLGNGPWVRAEAVGSARNPQPVRVIR